MFYFLVRLSDHTFWGTRVQVFVEFIVQSSVNDALSFFCVFSLEVMFEAYIQLNET